MENYPNNFATTLASGMDASTTTMVVVSAAGSVAPNMTVVVDNEEMLVTAGPPGSTTWTVARAQGGTAAATHASGADVVSELTQASFGRLIQLYNNGVILPARRKIDVIGRRFNLTDDGTDTTRLYLGDPNTMAFMNDDFLGTASSSTPNVSDSAWSWANGTSPASIAGEANHPGIWRRSTSTASGAACYMFLSQIIPADTFSMVWIVRLNVNDTDTALALGLSDQINQNSTPTNGILFRKVYADTNWQTVTRAASVETGSNFSHEVTDATNGPISTNFARFRIRRVDASTIGFRINGGTEKLHTGNIPTVALYPWIRITSQTATAKTYDIDYFDMQFTGLTR